MIIAAPGISDNISTPVERDRGHEQVLNIQLEDRTASHCVKAPCFVIIVREIAVWVESALRAILEDDPFFSDIVRVAVSIGHWSDYYLSRAKEVC